MLVGVMLVVLVGEMSSSSSVCPAIALRFTILGEIFAFGFCDRFQSNHRGTHIPSSWIGVMSIWLFSVSNKWLFIMVCMCVCACAETASAAEGNPQVGPGPQSAQIWPGSAQHLQQDADQSWLCWLLTEPVWNPYLSCLAMVMIMGMIVIVMMMIVIDDRDDSMCLCGSDRKYNYYNNHNYNYSNCKSSREQHFFFFFFLGGGGREGGRVGFCWIRFKNSDVDRLFRVMDLTCDAEFLKFDHRLPWCQNAWLFRVKNLTCEVEFLILTRDSTFWGRPNIIWILGGKLAGLLAEILAKSASLRESLSVRLERLVSTKLVTPSFPCKLPAPKPQWPLWNAHLWNTIWHHETETCKSGVVSLEFSSK